MNEQIVSSEKIEGRIKVSISILFVPVWIYYVVNFLSTPNVTIKELLLVSLPSIVVLNTSTIVHEYSHLFVAKLLKYPSKAHILKKPHVEFSKDLSKRDFVFIAIAPLIVHLMQVLVLQLLFPNFLILHSWIAFVLILGCAGDIYMIYRVLCLYRISAVLRFKERGVFEVVPRNAGHVELSK